MNTLTTVLQTIRIQNVEYFRVEVSTPWGIKDGGEMAVLHIQLQGEGYLEVEGSAERIFLQSGDSCLIMQGTPFILRDQPYTRPDTSEEIKRKCPVSERRVLTNHGKDSSLVALLLRFHIADMQTNPLLMALPPVMVIRGEAKSLFSRIQPLMQSVADEIIASHPGADLVSNRLAEALFTQIVYTYILSLPAGVRGWLNGLGDPLIAPVLGLIHQHPERPWKVSDFATSVQLSSSAFSARFSAVIGESPLQYLTRWRMQKAASLLREKQASIKEVAVQVGYESEASLSNTFKKWMGVWPGAYRRSGLSLREQTVSVE